MGGHKAHPYKIMFPAKRKTTIEKIIENFGFLISAAVFFGILFFVINKLTQNQELTRIILVVIIIGLLIVNQINHRYKRWVW